jgi:hypothetical protein
MPRRPPPAGPPPRRPTRWNAARGGSCSATRLLNQMADSIEVSNQNVAAAVAAYAQARALVTEQRASLFPVVA